MKKSSFGLGFLSVLSAIVSAGLVSAAGAGDSVRNFLDNASAQLNPIVGWLLGDAPTSDMLIVKILIFIILLAATLVALEKLDIFKGRSGFRWLVGIIIGILSARFLSSSALINFVWMPYGILGILLATVLPFIIWFYFIESFNSPTVRKVGWAAFAVIYIFLAITRWDDLAWASSNVQASSVNIWLFSISVFKVSQAQGEWWQNFGWIYVLIAIVSFIFILSDRYLRGKYLVGGLTKRMDEKNQRRAYEIVAEIDRLEDLLVHAEGEHKKDIESDIKEKRDALARILAH